MEQNHLKELTIGEIVANDLRTSSVFKKAGIDFCCGGKQTLSDACREHKLDLVQFEKELIEATKESGNEFMDFKSWDAGFLSDYIVNTHHKFVQKNLPDLLFYTQKIADVHGDNHPELIEIADLFKQINDELLQHLKNEEEVLFPAIKEVAQNDSEKAKATIKTEIERMTGEHEFAGGAMDQINRLSKGYQVPADGCNTYQVTFHLLEKFEDDLHVHVHLENNILYPKALNLAS